MINDNYVSVSHGPCTESPWLYTVHHPDNYGKNLDMLF